MSRNNRPLTAAQYADLMIPMQGGCMTLPRIPKTNGYIRIMVDKRHQAAHRVIWEHLHGPVPAGMVLDHTCHSDALAHGACSGGTSCQHRRCVRPDHLRPITQSENIRAGAHSIEAKGACPAGHSYSDPANVMTRKNGTRECAECNRIRARKRSVMTLTTHYATLGRDRA